MFFIITSLPIIDVNEMMWLEKIRITNNTTGATGLANICRRQQYMNLVASMKNPFSE